MVPGVASRGSSARPEMGGRQGPLQAAGQLSGPSPQLTYRPGDGGWSVSVSRPFQRGQPESGSQAARAEEQQAQRELPAQLRVKWRPPTPLRETININPDHRI